MGFGVTLPLGVGWQDALGSELEAPYLRDLLAFVAEERVNASVCPSDSDVFAALRAVPFGDVKVVVLGQDPYIRSEQANGLAFSVPRGVRVPPSLRNIYKELDADLGISPVSHGDLSRWTGQGVLLLNAVLTVREGVSFSHAGRGWERFTDAVIAALSQQRAGLVFLLWGRPAQEKVGRIDAANPPNSVTSGGRPRHLVLRAAHPSPLSASRGFFGCRHFSATNEWLREHGETEIDWALDRPAP